MNQGHLERMAEEIGHLADRLVLDQAAGVPEKCYSE